MLASPQSHLEKNMKYWNSPESMAHYGKKPRLKPAEERALKACFPQGGNAMKVLDIACGAGRVGYFIAATGARVVGIDLAENLLQRGRSRYPHIDFRKGNAEHLEFADEAFDAVMFMANGLDCLSPKESRERSLREVHRVLKPGGMFLASHHNLASLLVGWYKMMRPWKLGLRLVNTVNGNFSKKECYISHPKDSGNLPYYYCWPSVFVKDVCAAGFDFVEIFPNSALLALLQGTLRTTLLTRLCDPWPNYMFQKRES